ncbi:MAG: IclR family transcriptional regulator [Tropicimonas sp.]|uniref:IclR family transcriptional regulator n=1 Tax=Tropicimonas sp. TaxID=2067044 RepID=UPI003A88AFDA
MGMQGKKGASYQAPAVEKALDVLEFLAEQPDGAMMKDITAGLGRSMSEIYRMVLALENRRFVHKDPESERYYLSLRLFELAHRHPPVARLVRFAHPVMEGLGQRSMQSCHLAITEMDRLVILATADSPTAMHYGVKVGSSFPLLETSSGAVITAFAHESRQQTVLRGLDEGTKRSLKRRFQKIRREGGEIRRSDVVEGVTNISFAVRELSGHAVAALTVPYLKQTRAMPGEEEIAAMTRDAALELSAALGHKVENTQDDD